MTLSAAALAALHDARAAEKQQALFYRALASRAEDAGDYEDAERLNGLVADEQHHLSRLSARLLELGERLADLSAQHAPPAAGEAWEVGARAREAQEVERYERLLALPLDEHTADMLREFLEVERRHRESLGGKWMKA